MPDREITREQRNRLVDQIEADGGSVMRLDHWVLGLGIWAFNDGQWVLISSPEADRVHNEFDRRNKGRFVRSGTHLLAELYQAPLTLSYGDLAVERIDEFFEQEPQTDANPS